MLLATKFKKQAFMYVGTDYLRLFEINNPAFQYEMSRKSLLYYNYNL